MEIEKLITLLSIVGMIIAWGKDLLKLRGDESVRQKEEQAKTRADLVNDYERCCKERDRLEKRCDELEKKLDKCEKGGT
ncbi:hypothetical protein CCP3SC15_1500003 [Gammaproteobacteria bacterium]